MASWSLTAEPQAGPADYLTFNGDQDDPRVVVRDDVSVAVLGLVDLQVGVLPGELLARIN